MSRPGSSGWRAGRCSARSSCVSKPATMRSALRRRRQRYGRGLKRGIDALIGLAAVAVFKLLGRTNPDHMANFAGKFMRTLGPWLPEHRVGRANLVAAFPQKSAAEIETILRGVWDNLGRVVAGF